MIDYKERNKKQWETRRKNGTDKPWNKGKTGVQVSWNKGKTLENYPNVGFQKGHKCFTSKEGYMKGGKKRSGKNHPLWNNGITPLRIKIWQSFQHRQWRSDVFTRDNFTCQDCFTIGGKLEAHHIQPMCVILFNNNINTLEEALECDELFNINNGRTLCKECHKKTDSYGEKAKKFIKYTA